MKYNYLLDTPTSDYNFNNKFKNRNSYVETFSNSLKSR